MTCFALFGWDDILKLLQALIEQGQLAGFLLGMGGSFVIWFKCMRPNAVRMEKKLEASRSEAEGLRAANAYMSAAFEPLKADHARQSSTIEELSRDCEQLKSDLADSGEERDYHKEQASLHAAEVDDLTAQVRQLTDQIQAIADFDGKIWERPLTSQVAPFRPLESRRVPIVSVLNLKGGVGKTTLAANLGATLWDLGRRVLLIDLDHQASLTSLCLSDQEIQDIRVGKRFVHDFFKNGSGSVDDLLGRAQRIKDSPGFLIAADEPLADVEMQVMARWLLGITSNDVRFQLRHALHSPVVHHQYDWVLIDCPPRLTTASINALMCSDYVLIPVLLDQTSAEAVPRLLKWLRGLKQQLCQELKILGIVGNRAYPTQGLVGREDNVWRELPKDCMTSWGEPVHHFKAIIRNNGKFADAALANHFAAFDPSLQPIFRALVKEIFERIPAHESLRPASVH